MRTWMSESSSPRPSGSAGGPATTRHAGRGSGLEESCAAVRAPLREALGTEKRTTPSRCSTSRHVESRRSGRFRGWRSASRGSRSPSSAGSYTGHFPEAKRRSVCILLSTPEERKVELAGTIMMRPSCLSYGVSLCWRVAGWTTSYKSVSGLEKTAYSKQKHTTLAVCIPARMEINAELCENSLFSDKPVIVAHFFLFLPTELCALNGPKQLESLALCSYFCVFPALHAPTTGYADKSPLYLFTAG